MVILKILRITHFKYHQTPLQFSSFTEILWKWRVYRSTKNNFNNNRISTSDLSIAHMLKETRNTIITTALLWSLVASPALAQTLFATIGDYGDGSTDEGNVAGLVYSWNPDFIITLGDNRYGSNIFDESVGQFYCDSLTDAGNGSFCSGGNSPSNAFFPSLGNHDYTDGAGLNEYLDYFILPGAGVVTSGTSGSERYYDFTKGPVHFFVIDSQSALNSASDKTTQMTWLQAQLTASSAPWQVVYFHHAPYSSANHGSNTAMQWPFASWGADAVISGHDHTYERIFADGIVYFVNGLGGRSIYGFNTPVSGSEVRYNGDYGAMRVDASDTAITFEFINLSANIIDTYTIEAGIPGSGAVNIRIAQSTDDVEENLAGAMYINSSDLELGNDPEFNGDQAVGLRFQNVTIPQGATITAAYLEFETDESGSSLTTVTIAAEASNNASAFTSSNYNLTGRPTTLASVGWNIPVWDTINQKHPSPDLSTMVQEVVDRTGWRANNSLAFIITGNGTRTAESYDGEPAAAPLLHVEYTTGGGANTAPTAAFTYSCTDLGCSFTDASTDSDGSVTAWSWHFGDGGSSNTVNPSHTYAAAGPYNVTLTVTDNEGGSDSVTQSVMVTAPSLLPAAPTNLTTSVQSSGRGKKKVITDVQLDWSDNSSNEDVFVIEHCEETGKGKNKACIFAEFAFVGANSTSFSDSPGSGRHKYRVKARNAQGDSAYTNEVKI
jgi:PKD repeat protein